MEVQNSVEVLAREIQESVEVLFAPRIVALPRQFAKLVNHKGKTVSKNEIPEVPKGNRVLRRILADFAFP